MVVSTRFTAKQVRIALGSIQPAKDLVFVSSQVSIRTPLTAGTSMHVGCKKKRHEVSSRFGSALVVGRRRRQKGIHVEPDGASRTELRLSLLVTLLYALYHGVFNVIFEICIAEPNDHILDSEFDACDTYTTYAESEVFCHQAW